ncbi:MAG: hypothetical protein BGO10_09625 [Chlamydia sp. 32-24]|nr:MAG: hypothetical protein BGO10_09625 [Chlamydia sp. 32-24]
MQVTTQSFSSLIENDLFIPDQSDVNSISQTTSIKEFAKSQTEKNLSFFKTIQFQNEQVLNEDGIVVNSHLQKTIYSLGKKDFEAIYQFVNAILNEKISKTTFQSIFNHNLLNFFTNSIPEVSFVGGFAIEILRQCAKKLLEDLDLCDLETNSHLFADIDLLLKQSNLSRSSIEFYSYLCNLCKYTPNKYDINFPIGTDEEFVKTLKTSLRRLCKNPNDYSIVSEMHSQYMHLSTKGESHDFDISLSFDDVSHIFTIDAVRVQIPGDGKGEIQLISAGPNIYQTEFDILTRSLRLTDSNAINSKAFWKAFIYLSKGFTIKKLDDLIALSKKALDKLLINGFVSGSIDMLKDAREKHANNDPDYSLALFLTIYDNNRLYTLFDETSLQGIKANLPKSEDNTIYSTFGNWPLHYHLKDYLTLLQFSSLLSILLPREVSKVSLVNHCEELHFQIHDRYFCLTQYKPDDILTQVTILLQNGKLGLYSQTLNELLDKLFFFAPMENLPLEIPFFTQLVEFSEKLLKQDKSPHLQKIGYKIAFSLTLINPHKFSSKFIELTPTLWTDLPQEFKTKILNSFANTLSLPKHTIYLLKNNKDLAVLTLGWALGIEQSYYSSAKGLKEIIAKNYYEICCKYLTLFKENRSATQSFFASCLKEKHLTPYEKILLLQNYGDEKYINVLAQFIESMESYPNEICPIIAKLIPYLAKNSIDQALQLWQKVKEFTFWSNNPTIYCKVLEPLQSYYYTLFDTSFKSGVYDVFLKEFTEDKYSLWSVIANYKAFSKIVERFIEFSKEPSEMEAKKIFDKFSISYDVNTTHPQKNLKKANKKAKDTTFTIEIPILQNYSAFIKQKGILSAILTLHHIHKTYDVSAVSFFENALYRVVVHCNHDSQKFSLPRKLLDILLIDLSKKQIPIPLLRTYSEKTLKSIHTFYLNSHELFDKTSFCKIILSYASTSQIEQLIEKMLENRLVSFETIFSLLEPILKCNTYKSKLFLNQFFITLSKDQTKPPKKILDFIQAIDGTLIDKDVWFCIMERVSLSDLETLKLSLNMLSKSPLDIEKQNIFKEKIFKSLSTDSAITNEQFFSLVGTYAEPQVEYLKTIFARKDLFKDKKEFYLTLQKYPELFQSFASIYFKEYLQDCLSFENTTFFQVLFEVINLNNFDKFIEKIFSSDPIPAPILSVIEKNFEKFTAFSRKKEFFNEWIIISSQVNLNDICQKTYFKTGFIEIAKKVQASESFFNLWKKLFALNDLRLSLFNVETIQDLLQKLENNKILTSDNLDYLLLKISETVISKKIKIKNFPLSTILSNNLTEEKIVVLFAAIREETVDELEATKLIVQVMKALPNHSIQIFHDFMAEFIVLTSEMPGYINQEISNEAANLCLYLSNIESADILQFITLTNCLNDFFLTNIVQNLVRYTGHNRLIKILEQACNKKLYTNEYFIKLFFYLHKSTSNDEFIKVYIAIEDFIEQILESNLASGNDFLLCLLKRVFILETLNQLPFNIKFSCLKKAFEKLPNANKSKDLVFWYVNCKYTFTKTNLSDENYIDLINDFYSARSLNVGYEDLFLRNVSELMIKFFEKKGDLIPQLETQLLPFLDLVYGSSLNLLLASLPYLKDTSPAFKNRLYQKIKLSSSRLSECNNAESVKTLANKNIYLFIEDNIKEITLEPKDLKAIFGNFPARLEEMVSLFYFTKCEQYFDDLTLESLDALHTSLSNFINSTTYFLDPAFKKALGSYIIPLLYNLCLKQGLQLEIFMEGIERIFQVLFPSAMQPFAKKISSQITTYKALMLLCQPKVSALSLPTFNASFDLFETSNTKTQVDILESILNGLILIVDKNLNTNSDLFYLTHLLVQMFVLKSYSKTHLKLVFDIAISNFSFYDIELFKLNLTFCKRSFAVMVNNISKKVKLEEFKLDVNSDLYYISRTYFLNSDWHDKLVNEDQNYLSFLLYYIEKNIRGNKIDNLQIPSFIEIICCIAESRPSALNFKSFDNLFLAIFSLFFDSKNETPFGDLYSVEIIRKGVFILKSILKLNIEKKDLVEKFYLKIQKHYVKNPLFALEAIFAYITQTAEFAISLGKSFLKNHIESFDNFFILLKTHFVKEEREVFSNCFTLLDYLSRLEVLSRKTETDSNTLIQYRKKIDNYKKEWKALINS